jgi:cytochrome b6-f complex iron-sulfur subunit
MADSNAGHATADKDAAPPRPDRREFLQAIPWLGIAWASFAAAVGVVLGGTVRFLYPNVLYEPPQQFKVGFPGDFQVGEVSTQFKNSYGVWVVRNEQGFYALISVCTHLGCTPNWLANENKFKCPCHGSGFYMTGINFEGPAPRPLERAAIVLADDGQIEIDKSLKFLYEQGGWDDPSSFLLFT